MQGHLEQMNIMTGIKDSVRGHSGPLGKGTQLSEPSINDLRSARILPSNPALSALMLQGKRWIRLHPNATDPGKCKGFSITLLFPSLSHPLPYVCRPFRPSSPPSPPLLPSFSYQQHKPPTLTVPPRPKHQQHNPPPPSSHPTPSTAHTPPSPPPPNPPPTAHTHYRGTPP